MKVGTFNAVKFISKGDQDFGVTVRKRVNEYFKTKKIPKTGDYRIWIKVLALPLLLLVPFILILTNVFAGNLLGFYGLWLLMGGGLAGCGLGIMHDACHGAISKKRSVNEFIGALVLNLAGGSVLNWKIQHNILHHSYTNIDGYDEDIDPSGLMRFSPNQKVKPLFRFQVYYAWILYGLMTFEWATYKDFLQLKRYKKRGLLKLHGATSGPELTKLIILKILYYSLFIVAPILLLDLAWWHIILGWLSMHFVAGVILGSVFQPAHVVPTSEFPAPNKDNKVKGDWAIHQLLTTANFAPTNRILSWYVGGLNYQIEHHLFPNMSHIHHRRISEIVKRTAKEFGLPYYSQPTFVGALANHAKMLHKLRK